MQLDWPHQDPKASSSGLNDGDHSLPHSCEVTREPKDGRIRVRLHVYDGQI
jgi:hypothetical protein